jgi:hypothetical protein
MAFANSKLDQLVNIHHQRPNYAYWSKTPTAINECQRCGMKNYHSYLFRCYGCNILYCCTCTADDPVFLFEYGDFIPIFCEVECKERYMRKHHDSLSDCDECHMMWPKFQYKNSKICDECVNGVCDKCRDKIEKAKITHSHLDWEDRT